MTHRWFSYVRHVWRTIMVWRIRHVSDNHFLMVMAVAVGLIAGSAAFILKWCVKEVSSLLTSHLNPDGINPMILIIPVVGIVSTGIFIRYILRINVENGTSRLMMALHRHDYRMKKREMAGSLVASILTLGFGGSAGGEGPIAFTGAAFGSNIARACHASRGLMRLMIGIGAGAGIAGIFKAPLGGVLFTLEVMAMPMSTWPVIALITSCIISAMTCRALSGFTLDMDLSSIAPLAPHYLPEIVLLGIFCGLYSIYYSSMCQTTDKFFHSIRNNWARNILSGLSIGLCIMLFPVLYGEGYGSMRMLLDGNTGVMTFGSLFASELSPDVVHLLAISTGVLLIKAFAKSATTSGGGVAGDFAPTLFAGCIAGFLFAGLVNMIPGCHMPTSQVAFIAMAGVMAGAIGAPLMAICIVAEMSAAYVLFLPLTVVAFVSYGTVRLLNLYRKPDHSRILR